MRRYIVYVVPFLLPFVLYGIYWLIAKRRAAKGKTMVPWVMLLGAGLVLSVGTAATLALTTGSAPDTIYVPPHVKDGVIVPGQHIPKP